MDRASWIARATFFEIAVYKCEELATQLISHHASIFLGVIRLGMNKPGPWKCPWTGLKKRTKNENTAIEEQAKVGGKLRPRLWDQACKRSIKSRVEKGVVMIVHVLSGWLASS